MDLVFRYSWIHLPTIIVKEGIVSRQSSIYLFRYGQIHLLPVIVKENSVSRQSSIDTYIQIWLDSLTLCNSKGGQVSAINSVDLSNLLTSLYS
jgi:hypothetical protein